MSETHAQSNGHDHDHGGDPHAPIVEANGVNPYGLRIQAIAELLIEKGIISQEELAAASRELEGKTPADGARLVARAWVDPEFKRRLLEDTRAAAAELGIDTTGYAYIVTVENSDKVH